MSQFVDVVYVPPVPVTSLQPEVPQLYDTQDAVQAADDIIGN